MNSKDRVKSILKLSQEATKEPMPPDFKQSNRYNLEEGIKGAMKLLGVLNGIKKSVPADIDGVIQKMSNDLRNLSTLNEAQKLELYKYYDAQVSNLYQILKSIGEICQENKSVMGIK